MAGLQCGGCGAEVMQSVWNLPAPVPCLQCGRAVQALVFLAAWRPAAAAAPERIAAPGEANCYEHEANRAVAACDSCGRFVCALCELPIGSLRVCPACFQSGKAQPVAQSKVHRHVHHDSIALALSTLPLLFCWVAIFTTPYAVFHALWHWRDRSPVVPRGKWRLWLTLLSASIQFALLAWAIYFFATLPGSGR
jgi:hypothetical protein